MHKSKRKWNCVDCSRCTKLEHYFVHTPVWTQAGMGEVGMLCIGCLEARLGRELTSNDFTTAHINDPRRNAMTDRLRNRIIGSTIHS